MTRMPLFSNNPGLERMMQQKPTGRRGAGTSGAPARSSCYGCNYGMGRRCIGVCYKQLLKGRRNTRLKLVVAEKPSVAQSLAAVLGAKQKKQGYLEGGGFLVSWCVGHLVGLAPADATIRSIPSGRMRIYRLSPKEWQFTVDPGKKEQFKVLSDLMNPCRCG